MESSHARFNSIPRMCQPWASLVCIIPQRTRGFSLNFLGYKRKMFEVWCPCEKSCSFSQHRKFQQPRDETNWKFKSHGNIRFISSEQILFLINSSIGVEPLQPVRFNFQPNQPTNVLHIPTLKIKENLTVATPILRLTWKTLRFRAESPRRPVISIFFFTQW